MVRSLTSIVPLSEETNIGLLDQVIKDQTGVLHQVFGQDFDVSTIPQLWALCKFGQQCNCNMTEFTL